MNDSTPLSGLAKQLVLNELLDEKTARQAQVQAARNKQSLVSHLVQAKLVQSRALVEVAAEQFGIAYCDLNSLDRESIPKDVISERLVRQHRVLPLWKRGNKLFIGLSDPTNHQAVTDIQFSTGLTTEALLVEDDKLGVAIEKLYEGAMDALGDLGDIDLDGVDVGKAESASQDDGGDDAEDARWCASSTRCCSTPSAAALPTCTSSPTKRPTGCASVPTACSTKWPSRRSSWPAAFPRDSR